jgi:hypothetical protein
VFCKWTVEDFWCFFIVNNWLSEHRIILRPCWRKLQIAQSKCKKRLLLADRGRRSSNYVWCMNHVWAWAFERKNQHIWTNYFLQYAAFPISDMPFTNYRLRSLLSMIWLKACK